MLLYVLLGSVYDGKIEFQGLKVPAAQALLGGMIGYGAANTAFAGIAITLVIRREDGLLKRLRATPLPAAVLMGAMLVSTLIVFALETLTLFVLGRLVYGTPFPDRWLSLAAAVLLSTACFAALGIATASLLRSAEGSSAAVNVILLPMAFISGSFGPTRHLPEVLQAIGDVLPLKYAIRLVDTVYLRGDPVWSQPSSIAMLAAWGAGGSRRRAAPLPVGAAGGLIRLAADRVGATHDQPSPSLHFASSLDARARRVRELRHLRGPRGDARRDRRAGAPAAAGDRRAVDHLRGAARDRAALRGVAAPGADRGRARQLPPGADREELGDLIVRTAIFWARMCAAERHAEL